MGLDGIGWMRWREGMDELVDRCMDGWMDGWMDVYSPMP